MTVERPRWIFDDDDWAAVLSCADGICQVTRMKVDRARPLSRENVWFFDDFVLPMCSG